MSSNHAPIDLQVGDFVDLEGQLHQVKIVFAISPQGVQLKDPLATFNQNLFYQPSRIKGFRTFTKLKEYSNPSIGYIRRVKTSTQQIHQLKQTMKQIMAAPLSFSAKQLIQTLRGRHYYMMHSLMMSPIESEEAYLSVVSYLNLQREFFIKFILTVDFSSYDPSNIYDSSMSALCSSYPELIELTEIATGVASEFSQFRKNSQQFHKKEAFEQEVQEWLETQFLVNFVEAKYQTFPAQLLILMIVSVNKIARGLQIEVSEPLGDYFESLYSALLVMLQKQSPPIREINILVKFIPTLFKTIHRSQELSSSLSCSKVKITDSSLTEKLESCGEQAQNLKISEVKMRQQSESIPSGTLSRQQFSKAKELQFKFHLALSYLRHGLKENCFTEINTCMTEISKDCKIKEEVAHLQSNWPRIGGFFLQLARQKGFFEELLKINNFMTSMVSVRSILLKFFPYLPKEISVACIKLSKSSILKQVLSQRPVFREDFYEWLCQYVYDLKVQQNQIKDVNELIKHLQPLLKSRPTFPNCNLWRQRLFEKQYALATSMKNVEFNIFDNLFGFDDDLKLKVFKVYLETQVLPNLNNLLQHFHQFLLFKYTSLNRITSEQFEMMLNPMLQKQKEAVIYQRRKMSVINALHCQFTKGQDKSSYFSFLSKFIEYYSHPSYDKAQMINSWGNFSVYPASIPNQKAFFLSLSQEFCQEMFPKLIPFSSELDIQLANSLFCKLNSLKEIIVLDDKLEITTVTDVPDYFDEIIQGLYYLPKDEIKSLQRYIEIYFKAAPDHVFYRMLDRLLAIIIKNQATGVDANFLYKRLKCKFPLTPQKTECLAQDFKLKFTNFSVIEKFQEFLCNFQNDPYRRLIAQEVTTTSIVMQARNSDSLHSIKFKLGFRVNRDPSQILLLDKDGNMLSDEIEKRNIGSSIYLFTQQNHYRQLRNQGKLPTVPIFFKVEPERSPAHQSLLKRTVDLFMLLPKTSVILSGIDFRIEEWASFDQSSTIAQLFQRAVTERIISQISGKSTYAVTSLLDYFLWRKKPEELNKYDFCCLLSLLKRIENQSDILFNLKIVYLIYSSSNFNENHRDQLLSSLLFLQPADLRTNSLDEEKSYDLLTDLVYIILEQYPKGALEFYFTTEMVEKFYEIETSYNSFKRHWKNIFQESSFEEKIQILNSIEDRMLKYPDNLKELGSLIEKTQDPDLICLYETTLERMARQVVLLNRVKATGHFLKISCNLLNNCRQFIEKEIRCDYLVHREFVFFLRDNFYDYVFHIPDVIFSLILYCMNQPSHRDAFIQFFQTEISEEEWQKREYLEGGRRYRQPQAQGYVGLVNCFNTCYANSLFQQLFHNDHFAKELLATDWPRNDLQKEDLILQLKKIFVHLKESQHPYQNRTFFDSAFKLCDGYPVQTTIQMDVDEFRNLLFNHLQEIIPKNMFWSRIFEGKEESQIKCLECLNVSSTLETYNSICLSVQDFTNLESSLDAHHQPLILEKDNAYFCEKCNKKVRAQKSLIIKSLPPCLIFVLKRFEYIADKGFRRKLNNYFEFPMNEIQLEGGRKYSLKGIISHMGYSESGHYISYVKLKGQWYEFNDARVRQLSEDDVKLNSYGSLRGSQKSTVTERTAYLLFYESIQQPLLETGMQIQCQVLGVQQQLSKIRLQKRLLNKEIAYLNHHFLEFLIRLVLQYPTVDALHLLFLGVLEISFKLRFPEGNEGQLYQDKILKALHLLARNQSNLYFMWQSYPLQRTLLLINSSILVQYKAALAYLLAQNCHPNADTLAEVLDLCLRGIYQTRVDASANFALLHYLALKYEQAAQYLHSQRIIGRILDLTFVGLTSQETRTKLKTSSTVEFQRTTKFQGIQLKQQLKYHKWALLVYIFERQQQNLDQSQLKYLYLQQNTSFMQRVIDQCRTKPTMHYVSRYFCLLIRRYDIDFANKLLGVIRDGVSKEKGDGFRRYIVILQWILSVKTKDHEQRNKNAVNILYKMLQNHNYANDNTFEYLWLWILKIMNGNEVLRKQVASSRSMFEFLYFKPYTNTSFYRTQRNNALPIKTRHRLHHIPVPLLSSELLPFYNKKIENTKAILNRVELPFFTSEMVVEQPTVQKNIKPHTHIYRFYDVTQQFEEYTVLWAIGDLIALQTPIPKEKFPNSVFLLKGDERVCVKEQKEEIGSKSKGKESAVKQPNGSDELSEGTVKKEQKEEGEVKKSLAEQ